MSTPLAKGFTSDVYAWGQGRVLKLFLDSVPNFKIQREFTATRAVYAVLGATDQLQYLWYAGDHDFPPAVRKAAVEWFRKWLARK